MRGIIPTHKGPVMRKVFPCHDAFMWEKNVKNDVKYLRLDRRFPLWIRSDGNIWICIYLSYQTFTCLILFREQKNICIKFSLPFHHPGLFALLFVCVFVRGLCSLIICHAHKTNPWFHDLNFHGNRKSTFPDEIHVEHDQMNISR